jgi:hypothetical protein
MYEKRNLDDNIEIFTINTQECLAIVLPLYMAFQLFGTINTEHIRHILDVSLNEEIVPKPKRKSKPMEKKSVNVDVLGPLIQALVPVILKHASPEEQSAIENALSAFFDAQNQGGV